MTTPKKHRDTPRAKAPASPARVAANRANAKRSTGPRTAAGKARSSRNAIRHGAWARELNPVDSGILVESVYQLEHTLHAAINAYQPRDILEYHTAHELAMTSISDGRLEVLEAAILGTAGVLNPTPFQRAERELITLFEGLNSHLVKTVFDFGPNAHDLSGGFDLSPPVLLLALRLLVNRTRPVSSNPLVPTPKIDWPPLPETAEEQQAEFDQLIERHFGEPLDAQISVKEQLQDLRAHVDQVDARITHSEASRAIGNIDTVLATKQRVQNRRWGLLEQLRLLKSRPDHEIEPLPEPTDETNPSA